MKKNVLGAYSVRLHLHTQDRTGKGNEFNEPSVYSVSAFCVFKCLQEGGLIIKLVILLMLVFVQSAFAHARNDSLATQAPDSLKTLSRNQLQRLLVQKPRVEPDGVTIGNTKFFIMILRTDPSIDPKMVIKIPDGGNADRMPRMPYKAPGPPPDSLNRSK